MELFRAVDEVPAGFGPSAVTIGKFDGLHAGHRRLVGDLRAAADAAELTTAVVTFDRHPLSLLRPEECPEPLVSNQQKVELLAATGVDATLMVTFDEEFSQQSPERFVGEILVEALRARIVLVGPDFRFGSRGAGTVATLTDLGDSHGFEVRLIEEVRADGEARASSTSIRKLLSAGRVREAAVMLGRPHWIRSVIVRGAGRGRTLGFPTANLDSGIEGLLPADGVYAAWLTVDSDRYPAAVSIGNNPTFEGVAEHQVEAHVLDQELDLYDRTVELEFVDYQRPMLRFSGTEELVAQLRLDVESVRGVLSS